MYYHHEGVAIKAAPFLIVFINNWLSYTLDIEVANLESRLLWIFGIIYLKIRKGINIFPFFKSIMKGNLVMKKMIFGFALGAIIFGSAAVYASTDSSLLEVYYNVKDIKINNASLTPSQKPFIHEGTTYVPLRYISEALGQQVIWDEESQTVNINDCFHKMRDDPKDPQNYVCINNRRINIPEGVTVDGVIDAIEVIPGSPPLNWLLPSVHLKKGNSIMNISIITGIVMGELIDPNDKDPFEFMKPYITAYFPNANSK